MLFARPANRRRRNFSSGSLLTRSGGLDGLSSSELARLTDDATLERRAGGSLAPARRKRAGASPRRTRLRRARPERGVPREAAVSSKSEARRSAYMPKPGEAAQRVGSESAAADQMAICSRRRARREARAVGGCGAVMARGGREAEGGDEEDEDALGLDKDAGADEEGEDFGAGIAALGLCSYSTRCKHGPGWQALSRAIGRDV